MNDLEKVLARLNPMNQVASPEVGSSEAEAIFEKALAKYDAATPGKPRYQSFAALLGGLRSPFNASQVGGESAAGHRLRIDLRPTDPKTPASGTFRSKHWNPFDDKQWSPGSCRPPRP